LFTSIAVDIVGVPFDRLPGQTTVSDMMLNNAMLVGHSTWFQLNSLH